MKRALIISISLLSTVVVFGQVANSSAESTTEETVSSASTSTNADAVEETIEYLSTQIERKERVVESTYFVEEVIPGSVNSYGNQQDRIVTKQIKKRIYNAGQILIENEKANFSKAESGEEKIQSLEETIRIYNQMIKLGKIKNTRNWEKALKKLEEPEAIKPVFFSEE